MKHDRATIVKLIISIVLFAATAWIFVNRIYVVDQLSVWQYKPSPEIVQIAAKASFNDRGQFLFYASQPLIEERDEFNQHCRQHAEKTAILGCYIARKIYLYNITDARLEGIKEVTAAHEMLHAAYDRLSDKERTRINALIDSAAKSVTSPSIDRKLKLYDTTEPGERLNELHSMLGSEVKSLPTELEVYYSQYFTNRLALVSMAERYETVFTELEQQQKSLVAELNALADSINSDSEAYSVQFEALQVAIESFNQRAENGSFSTQSEFNAERNRLIAQQRALSSLRQSIETSVADYEVKRSQLEALNVTALGLQKSIDSASLPEVPSL